jgi:DNA-binding transcriptional MocR family regulator
MNQSPHIPRIVQLATRVEQDIRSRELRPGDPYINTEEVARMLGVTKLLANRAMQLLAKRRVLHRRQRKQVVIAEGILSMKRPPVRCVHFLVQKDYLKTEGLLVDGVLVGMQEDRRSLGPVLGPPGTRAALRSQL